MRSPLLAVLIILFASSSAVPHGALAVGTANGQTGGSLGWHFLSREEAIKSIIQTCTKSGWQNCRSPYQFDSICVAAGFMQNNFVIETANSQHEARDAVAQKCTQIQNGFPCREILSICDYGGDYIAQSNPNPEPEPEPIRPQSSLFGGSDSPILPIFLIVAVLVFWGIVQRGRAQVNNSTNQPQTSTFQQELAPQPQTTQAAQPFSDSGPATGMALGIKRSQRTGAFGKIIFALDARMDVSAETRDLIQKYQLGSHIIYESANREAYAAATKAHLENSRDNTSIFASPGRQALGVGKTFFGLARAAISAAQTAMSLRITVDSLIKGHHIECKDMHELLDAENELKQAAINLKAYLASATTFTGQEEKFEP